MQDVEMIRKWICTFPQWGEAELTSDVLDVQPDSAGLFCQGMELLSRQEDVTGQLRLSCRYSFTLRRVFLTRQMGSVWMENLAHWVLAQSHLALTPRLEGAADPCRVTAQGAKADWQKQTGTTVYTVRITADFERTLTGN